MINIKSTGLTSELGWWIFNLNNMDWKRSNVDSVEGGAIYKFYFEGKLLAKATKIVGQQTFKIELKLGLKQGKIHKVAKNHTFEDCCRFIANFYKKQNQIKIFEDGL